MFCLKYNMAGYTVTDGLGSSGYVMKDWSKFLVVSRHLAITFLSGL